MVTYIITSRTHTFIFYVLVQKHDAAHKEVTFITSAFKHL